MTSPSTMHSIFFHARWLVLGPARMTPPRRRHGAALSRWPVTATGPSQQHPNKRRWRSSQWKIGTTWVKNTEVHSTELWRAFWSLNKSREKSAGCEDFFLFRPFGIMQRSVLERKSPAYILSNAPCKHPVVVLRVLAEAQSETSSRSNQ